VIQEGMIAANHILAATPSLNIVFSSKAFSQKGNKFHLIIISLSHLF